MAYSLEIIKIVLKSFIDEAIADSKNDRIFHSEGEIFNQAIFEIESYFIQLRKEYQVNERLDTSISGINVSEDFNSVSADKAFYPVDYQFNFLHHLAIHHKPNSELHRLIDSFIDNFKHEFTLADIVITKTGVTRCRTNIRFALNQLRNLGLVLNKDKNDKRSWAPSILGLIALLNINLLRDERTKWRYFKEYESLVPMNYSSKKLNKGFVYDEPLLHSLNKFKDPTYLYTFFSALTSLSVTDADKESIQEILNDFLEFTEKEIEILPNDAGFRLSKNFSKASKDFQFRLLSQDKSYTNLTTLLLSCLRGGKT